MCVRPASENHTVGEEFTEHAAAILLSHVIFLETPPLHVALAFNSFTLKMFFSQFLMIIIYKTRTLSSI